MTRLSLASMVRPFPYLPPCGDIELVWEDEHLLVANKPAGLLCVPGRGPDLQDCLITRLQQMGFSDALVVHRLDEATSGLAVFARNALVQRDLSRQFATRSVQKAYTALVHGHIASEGECNAPIGRDWANRPLRCVDVINGKPSKTSWKTMAYDEKLNCSRVQLFPETGRTHQLRVHMAHVGHPIVGDRLYGSQDQSVDATRLMLHASRLALAHPITGIEMVWQAQAVF